MKKPVNHRNYKPGKGKKVLGKSMTVQDDATDLKTMLIRYSLGQPMDGKKGQYIEEPDLDDVDGEKFRDYDPTEQEDILEGMRAMSQRLKALELEYEAEMKERARAKDEALKTGQKEGDG